jgi:hypothetical protein
VVGPPQAMACSPSAADSTCYKIQQGRCLGRLPLEGWLHTMLRTTFFTPCAVHAEHLKKSEVRSAVGLEPGSILLSFLNFCLTASGLSSVAREDRCAVILAGLGSCATQHGRRMAAAPPPPRAPRTDAPPPLAPHPILFALTIAPSTAVSASRPPSFAWTAAAVLCASIAFRIILATRCCRCAERMTRLPCS